MKIDGGHEARRQRALGRPMTQYELESLISSGSADPMAEQAIDDANLLRNGRRKATPVFSGALAYFPDALEEIARVSKAGNDQHNFGQPLHWDRSKSTDELDALTRHLLDHSRGELRDTDGQLHLAKAAWRALAALQRLLDASR